MTYFNETNTLSAKVCYNVKKEDLNTSHILFSDIVIYNQIIRFELVSYAYLYTKII